MVQPDPNEIAQREQRLLDKLDDDERAMQARLLYFSVTAGGVSSSDIAGYVRELQAFWAQFVAQRSLASQLFCQGRPACSQKLEELISRVQYNIDTYQYTYNSRAAYEKAMGPRLY